MPFILFLVAIGMFVIIMVDTEMRRGPHIVHECIESHTESYPVFSTDPSTGVTTFAMQYYDVCDKTQEKCVIGSKYEGPETTCK